MLVVKQLKRSRRWVIVGQPLGADVPEGARIHWYGPYRTKAEAEEDRRGIERWMRDNAKERLGSS